MNIQEKLDKCRELVIENIKECSNLIAKWDGKPTNVTPEEHYENIVNWITTHVKNKAWSHTNSQKNRIGRTSYGAKHECEHDLQCYVANNWMKMAMIDAGLDVTNYDDVDYNSGKLYRSKIKCSDILTNSINFVFRVYDDMKTKWIDETDETLKYIG